VVEGEDGVYRELRMLLCIKSSRVRCQTKGQLRILTFYTLNALYLQGVHFVLIVWPEAKRSDSLKLNSTHFTRHGVKSTEHRT